MTNASLRERFGIADQNAAHVSRVIKEALAKRLIRPSDPAGPRAGYVPANF
jgi:ATP-dependent DNA helicase RecG